MPPRGCCSPLAAAAVVVWEQAEEPPRAPLLSLGSSLMREAGQLGARPAARRCLCCQLPLACPVGVDAGPLGSYPCPTWTVDEPADDDPTERRAIERRGGLRLSARRERRPWLAAGTKAEGEAEAS